MKEKIIGIGIGLLIEVWDFIRDDLYKLAQSSNTKLDDWAIKIIDGIIQALKKNGKIKE